MLPLIVATSLMIGAVSTQDVAAVDPNYGAFAFPNVKGTELIVVHEIPNAAELRTAICGGQLISVRFVRRQTISDKATGRQSPEEFDHLAGTVFQVVGRSVAAARTCFVAAESLLSNAELYPVRAFSSPAKCSITEQRRVAALRERAIRACWSVAAVQGHGLVSVVEYVREGTEALASLIVVTNERAIAIDFPAKYRGEGEEMWRAGDGGEFSPDGFNVPFVVRRGRSYFIALDWGAEEGNSLKLYSLDSGSPVRQAISDYWYRAPR